MSREKPEKKNLKPGLLNNSKPVFLAFAKIRKPHALKGEVSVEMLTNFPHHYKEDDPVYVGDEHEKTILRSIRKAGKTYLISFKEHNSRESVERFRNKLIFIKEESLPELEENEYYHHDLIGLSVYDMDETNIGEITEIITTGANDVYVVSSKEEERTDILLPAIKSVIKNVDLQNKRIIVELPEWL